MYAQVCTRPDIAFAVNMLSRFQSNAGHAHWVAGKKVLRYLKGTINHMLLYRRIDDQELKIECYTDASYKQDHDDLKSTSGYIFMLAGGAISWKASKQSLTATSTFQAEYIAIYDATSHAIWLKNFVVGLKIMDSIEKPLTIYCDNAAAVFFTKNNKRSSGSRNIDVKYFAVRENVRDKEIEVLKIGTKEQLADPFTKALPVECFKRHVKDMGIYLIQFGVLIIHVQKFFYQLLTMISYRNKYQLVSSVFFTYNKTNLLTCSLKLLPKAPFLRNRSKIGVSDGSSISQGCIRDNMFYPF
ncbi:hypothetical protein OSB04_031548 [Centaurea solstitialis]|uniref:RNA-directed DNA polymerase n=1 Tax=Centaurea solstitialis TaxID=347529 RepID=A0AA38S9Q4_9ASTR|nr:hypothetical protein OSB04_031548 [Centaurea solstitialis]